LETLTSRKFIITTPNAVFKALSDKKTIDLASIPKPTDAEIKAYYYLFYLHSDNKP
jgi:hypothetical protein